MKPRPAWLPWLLAALGTALVFPQAVASAMKSNLGTAFFGTAVTLGLFVGWLRSNRFGWFPAALSFTALWLQSANTVSAADPQAVQALPEAVRAVALPQPGPHRVEFEYRQPGLALGAVISGLTTLTLALMGAFGLKRRPKQTIST